jgi:tyrosyl-tRNA synthetase
VTQTIDSAMDSTDLTTDLAPSLLEELRWRGMLADHTADLPARLARGPIALYNGFDPSGDSLHVGHLVPVFGLLHFQRHGNRPVVVVGGGTGMIGDPSGRSAERNLLDEGTLERNVAGIRAQLARFLDFTPGPTGASIVNNLDWLGRYGLIEFLRDIGKHFTVPYMLAKDSVQQRLDGGLSFTEFSYMTLQSADFLHLFREDHVELQTGGADQWGNITAGLELIRKVSPGADVHALAYPLLTDDSGAKFGKTSSNTRVWLDPERTSPYAFFQYWIDRPDAEVGRLLRTFTLFDQRSIESLEAAQQATPEARPAQRALAFDITARVHGEAAADDARRASEARYGTAMPDRATLARLAAEPDFEVPASALANAVEFAVAAGIASSNGEARRLISQGGLRVNDERVTDPMGAVPAPIDGALFVRAGKRRLVGRVRGAG